MRKPDLATFIADKADLPLEKAQLALGAILGEITAALQRGDSVSLVGFGTFEQRQRAARRGKNPQTGAPVDIAASVGVGFRPGKALRDALN
jgi:DNA-binding protein HU-alpha